MLRLFKLNIEQYLSKETLPLHIRQLEENWSELNKHYQSLINEGYKQNTHFQLAAKVSHQIFIRNLPINCKADMNHRGVYLIHIYNEVELEIQLKDPTPIFSSSIGHGRCKS